MMCTCPSCGAVATLDVLLEHDASRALVADVVEISLPLGALVVRYLRLFKPAKQVLRTERLRKLLETLVPDMKRGLISRRGRDWAVSAETWKAGIEAVLDAHAKGSLDLPLQDHAYLHEVLMRMVDRHEGQVERETEASRRTARVSIDGPAPVASALQPTEPVPVPAAQAAHAVPSTGPSRYAQLVRAQNEARLRARDDAFNGTSQEARDGNG